MPKPHWQSKLHIPKELIPPGMTYGFVRVATLNEPDGNNWQNKMISGWKPVPRDRHLNLFPFIPIPGVSQNEQYINVGDLILCEKSTRDVERDRRERERDTMEQMQSISWTLDGPIAAPVVNESSPVQIERATAEFQED
jgi:hypothetical protein